MWYRHSPVQDIGLFIEMDNNWKKTCKNKKLKPDGLFFWPCKGNVGYDNI